MLEEKVRQHQRQERARTTNLNPSKLKHLSQRSCLLIENTINFTISLSLALHLHFLKAFFVFIKRRIYQQQQKAKMPVID